MYRAVQTIGNGFEQSTCTGRPGFLAEELQQSKQPSTSPQPCGEFEEQHRNEERCADCLFENQKRKQESLQMVPVEKEV